MGYVIRRVGFDKRGVKSFLRWCSGSGRWLAGNVSFWRSAWWVSLLSLFTS